MEWVHIYKINLLNGSKQKFGNTPTVDAEVGCEFGRARRVGHYANVATPVVRLHLGDH